MVAHDAKHERNALRLSEGFNQYMNMLPRTDNEEKPYNLDGLGQSYGWMSTNSTTFIIHTVGVLYSKPRK